MRHSLRAFYRRTALPLFVAVLCFPSNTTVARPQPERQLRARALTNLTALARLYGYVRYFHPSSELVDANLTATSDWTAFLAHAIPQVESASNDEELIAALRKVIAPFSSSIRIEPGETPAEKSRDIPAPDGAKPDHAVFWHHVGHGRTDKGVYVSTRTVMPLDQFADDKTAPAPGTAVVRSLSNNIWVEVPICLWVENDRTIPAARAKTEMPEAAPDQRTTFLASSMVAWNIFQHFYPYFDVVPNDWDGSLEELLRDAATASDEVQFGYALQRLVSKLHDGHGLVMHDALRRSHTLPLSLALVEGRVIITGVDKSIRDQLAVGDLVLAIDNRPIEELIKNAEKHISASTPQHLRYRISQELLVGNEGEVDLDIERADGSRKKVRIARVARDSTRAVEAWREPTPEKIAQIRQGIWYVNLDVITQEEFQKALPDLVNADGIVFDLRGYPRQIWILPIHHHIEKPSRSANWRIPLVLYPDREKMEFMASFWPVPPAQPKLPKNIVYITDGRAVSAAETYLAIVQEVGVDIVGEATAGTNGNINPVDIPGGYRLIWTGMKVLKHDESPHHGVGIKPTFPVQRTVAGIRAGKDEMLDAAIELVIKRANEQ